MTKLRKQRRRKVYRANVNRKRMRNKQCSTGKIKSDELKKAWNPNRSATKNLEDMGLVADPNKDIKIKSYKREVTSKIASTTEWITTDNTKPEPTRVPLKKHVAEELEKEANAPRKRTFQLPSSQVEWVTYLMDKYGSDFKAMARDKKNYNQETWKQIRAKIKLFMSVPEQYAKYLEERDLLDQEINEHEHKNLFMDDDSD